MGLVQPPDFSAYSAGPMFPNHAIRYFKITIDNGPSLILHDTDIFTVVNKLSEFASLTPPIPSQEQTLREMNILSKINNNCEQNVNDTRSYKPGDNESGSIT